MGQSFVIDCGSRSIKLHRTTGGAVSLQATCSWDPISEAGSVRTIGKLLADLTKGLPAISAIHVIGTAAARRNRSIAEAIAAACAALGWTYETLTQQTEAALIRQAFADRADCDIVNAGGGSIQIVPRSGDPVLLDFGITDLNAWFGLAGEPDRRRLAEAGEFVRARLPQMGPFVYSGGELSYLLALGADVDTDGRCTAVEFLRVAARVDAMSGEQLAVLSPFDAGWTGGAVASNAIVKACLARSGHRFYYASDVNIADGLIRGLAGRAADATHTGV